MKTILRWLHKKATLVFLYSASIVYIQVIGLELTNLSFGMLQELLLKLIPCFGEYKERIAAGPPFWVWFPPLILQVLYPGDAFSQIPWFLGKRNDDDEG